MKILALLTLSVALVGCKNQGGSSDDYNTDRGIRNTTTNDTLRDYNRSGITNQSDRSAPLPQSQP